MAVLTITISDATDGGAVRLLASAVAMNDLPNNVADRVSFRVPATVPRSQRYYWTRLWQELEAEASEDVREGRLRHFDDPLDAVRWLLSESESDGD